MAARIIVHSPSPTGGRKVHADGEILGVRDIKEFLRRLGLDSDDVDLEDTTLIEWRDGGPTVWM
ncbi:hypothetical protein [Streptomyces catenulae]|uniref:Uncharacterized protein n=1 Tax=Streptomyces catenulae TaxID=66875 RepID=A0ABV2YTF9_9ACTN|nr:hypothetical protein [Streptomyces catenulae]